MHEKKNAPEEVLRAACQTRYTGGGVTDCRELRARYVVYVRKQRKTWLTHVGWRARAKVPRKGARSTLAQLALG